MVAIGNPSAMNDINRIHTSNSGGGGVGGEVGFGGGFVNPSQQKNSLNTNKTSSNGDNLQGMHLSIQNICIFQADYFIFYVF